MDVPPNQIVKTILPSDVLLGRGQLGYQHPGNVAYRQIVRDRHRDYASTPGRRDALAAEVIEAIKNNGGRFLKHVVGSSCPGHDAKFWVQAPDPLVRAKVKQALRDTGRQSSVSSRRSANDRLISKLRPINEQPRLQRQVSTAFSNRGHIERVPTAHHRSHRTGQDLTDQDNILSLRATASTSEPPNIGLRHTSSVFGQTFPCWSQEVSTQRIPTSLSARPMKNQIHEPSPRIQSTIMGSNLSQLPVMDPRNESQKASTLVSALSASTTAPMTTKDVLQRYAIQEIARNPGTPSLLSEGELAELQDVLQIQLADVVRIKREV